MKIEPAKFAPLGNSTEHRLLRVIRTSSSFIDFSPRTEAHIPNHARIAYKHKTSMFVIWTPFFLNLNYLNNLFHLNHRDEHSFYV